MLRRGVLSLVVALVLAATTPMIALAQEAAMSKLPVPTKSAYAEVNGVKIWYQIYGEGDPIVLLHGGFGSVEMFGPNLAILSKTHTVIGVDLQAHGGTGPLGRPMSFKVMADDIAELIKALGYKKADLLGYSLGGGVALRLAIDRPEVVDRLVLVSTAYAFSNWHTFNYDGMKAMAADPAAAARGMVGTPSYQTYVLKAPGGEASWTEAVAEFASFIGEDYDWSAEMPKVTAPTLVIVADWDAVRISAATKMFEMLGGGTRDANWDRSGMGQNHFAVIPNATHYDIFASSAVSDVAIPFIDAYEKSAATVQ